MVCMFFFVMIRPPPVSTLTDTLVPHTTHFRSRRLKVTTNRGDELRARFVVMANGPINTPKVPRISGVENFRGKIFHTARWDYDYTGGSQEAPVLRKLADKREIGRASWRDRACQYG